MIFCRNKPLQVGDDLGRIADHEPLEAFDYNGNGRIDFADVVWLFNHL